MDGAAAEIGGECGNIIATFQATDPQAPTLLLAAHMDTVEPADGVEPQIDGDVVFSSGETILGADDKVGVAALMEIARILSEDDLRHGVIHLTFTVAEERGLHGAKSFDLTALKPAFAFTLDADGPIGTLDMRSPYHEKFTVEFTGRSAHGGVAPQEGINAIKAASVAIAGMNLGRIDEETTANVGVIEGGRATNIVPDKTRVMAEARSVSLAKLQAQVAHMRQEFEKGAEALGATVDLDVRRDFDGYSHKKNDPIVKIALQALSNVGMEPIFSSSGGGADANVFNSKGVATLNIGIGAGKVHTVDEHVPVASIVQLTEVTLEIIKVASKH